MSVLQYIRMTVYAATMVLHISHLTYVVGANNLKTHHDQNVRTFGEMRFRYFTCWNLFLQMLHACVAFYTDVLTLANSKEYQLPKRLVAFRDTLFSALLWPATFTVCSVFWSFFTYDRELILPSFVDQVLSRMSNHIIHTVIVPIAVTEILLRPRRVPKTHKSNLYHLLAYNLVYVFVLFYTYYERHFWLYPIFSRLHGTAYFPLLLIAILLTSIVFYYLQWHLVRLIWVKENRLKKVK